MPSDAFQLRGANVTAAGTHNRKILLHAIRKHGDISRNELAALTGLTPPAVFKIAKDLLDEGLVLSARTAEKSRGQPTHMLRLNPEAAFSLGLNIDRDHLTLVAVDFVGQVRARFHFPIVFAGPNDVRAFVANCLERMTAYELFPMAKLSGIGVAMPDDLGATVLPGQPARYAEWANVDAHDLLKGLVEVPVVQENDAAAAAIGEMLFGAGLELDTFFYVFVSAGLGGGLVINRKYIRGAHGRSGEIGFLPQINPLRSSQTNMSLTIGDAVLTTGLLRELHANGFADASLATLETLGGEAAVIIDAWVNRAADYLYLPLLTVLSTIDPEAILIGGALPPALTDALCLAISKRLSMYVGIHWPKMAVRPAQVATDPAAIGAAVLAFQGLWGGDIRQAA